MSKQTAEEKVDSLPYSYRTIAIELQSRLDKIAEVADYEMNNVDGPAYRILGDILALAKGAKP